MDDVLEMISGFETGNFSNTLTAPDDSKLKPLVDKLNSAAKILAAQNNQNNQNAAFIIDSLGIGIWKWDLITNSLEWDKNMILQASDQTLDWASGVKDLKSIEATADRIAKIVQALRTYSREAANDPMEKQSLLAVIDDTFELCRERFTKASIDVQVQVDAAITIRCRPAQVSQVFMNLLSNSYDALAVLDSRWVKIVATQKNGKVHIQFIDSGSALPETVVQKMMNPFFTTKEVGKGTGLGLSISIGIIKTHGGVLAYDQSAPHTTFNIELPDAQHFIKSETA